MAIRVIDGDAIAKSQKLKRGVEERWRIHYPYWLTLAKANGVFECDIELIHVSLYAYLIPSIEVKDVQEMADQFVSADVLRTWEQNDKRWGFFPGGEKSSRLPALPGMSHRTRYGNLPPDPPIELRTSPGELPDESWTTPVGFGLNRKGLVGFRESNQAKEDIIKPFELSGAPYGKPSLAEESLSRIWKKEQGNAAVCYPPDRADDKEKWEALWRNTDSNLLDEGFRLFAREQKPEDQYPITHFVWHAHKWMQMILDEDKPKPEIIMESLPKILPASDVERIENDFLEE